jgi:hypothetical protein
MGAARQYEAQTVYELERDGDRLYCNSVACVSSLISKGWRLSDPAQLSILARELATRVAASTHAPSTHFR